MEIINFFESSNKSVLIEKISAVDWSAAQFLKALLLEDRFYEMLGGWGELFLLMEGEKLISFLTFTGQDSVRDESLTPWIGFVYTAPEHRGHRYAGLLLAHAEKVAVQRGYRRIYIATDHIGLYEKYGYTYQEDRIDYWNDPQRVLFKDL